MRHVAPASANQTKGTNLVTLFKTMGDLGARDHEILTDAGRILVVDAAFSHGGAWAGAERLAEYAYLDLLAMGRNDIVARHEYALHMVLRRYRRAIKVKYASLTDLAAGVERTRNFPLDRAYRIGHALVDLMLEWRGARADKGRWIVVVRRLDEAQNLATRFYTSLARRGAPEGIDVVAAIGGVPSWLHADSRGEASTYILLFEGAAEPLDVAAASTALEQDPSLLSRINDVDAILPELITLLKGRNEPLKLAEVAMRAICLYNHFGYYEESGAFVPLVTDYLSELVSNEDDRWNYIGNIFQGMVMTGRAEEALALIMQEAEPYLTRPDLRSKMNYIVGMIHLRYSAVPDALEAERYLDAARADVDRSASILSPEDFAFFSVFKDNGLAFLRVRQGRHEEALDLCLRGYAALTEVVGDDQHRLHRSVLLYNSAQVLAMVGELEKSLEYLRLAAEMDPYYSEYYNDMGNILQRQERYEEAMDAYHLAETYSSPYPEVQFNMAVCLARLEQWQPAIDRVTRSLTLDPDQIDALLLRAELYGNIDELSMALEDFRTVRAMDGESAPALVNEAAIRFDLGEFDRALGCMTEVIALDRDVAEHYDNRAAIHEALGDMAACRADVAMAKGLRLHAVA